MLLQMTEVTVIEHRRDDRALADSSRLMIVRSVKFDNVSEQMGLQGLDKILSLAEPEPHQIHKDSVVDVLPR